MTLATLAALFGAMSVVTAHARARKVATAEVPVMTKSGEVKARRARRSA